MKSFVASIAKIPTTSDLIIIAGIGMAGTGLAHILSQEVSPVFAEMKDTLANYGLTSLASGFSADCLCNFNRCYPILYKA